jgi:integrative and conjugative element protein (TIGR02256 family)
MLFISTDKKFALQLEEAIMNKALSYISKVGAKETGGILMGNYTPNLNTAIIKTITGPTKDSKSGYTWFERGLKGLQALIDSSWQKQDYYLGEWHFHPNASPIPSGKDIKQMKEISNSKQYNCSEPILIIIGGNTRLHEVKAFVVHQDKIKELINEKNEKSL